MSREKILCKSDVKVKLWEKKLSSYNFPTQERLDFRYFDKKVISTVEVEICCTLHYKLALTAKAQNSKQFRNNFSSENFSIALYLNSNLPVEKIEQILRSIELFIK